MDFQIYPTLIGDDRLLNVLINTTENFAVKYELIDMIGRVAYQKTDDLVSGENENTLVLNNLHSGHYFVTIKNKKGQALKTNLIYIR